jgi:hypothetical protein
MTTSLLTVAKGIEAGLERLSQKDQLIAQVQSLTGVDRRLGTLLDELDSTASWAASARGAGFVPAPTEVTGTLSNLADLANEAQEGRVDPNQAQGVLDEVRSIAVRVENEIKLAWREHVATRVPSQDGLLVLADAFSHVKGAGQEAARLRSAVTMVQTLLTRAPTEEAVAELDRRAVEIPELLQRLVGDDPDVRAFADQLARGGASIEALTPPILTWMRDKGFADSFKVVPGEPADR